jgi:isocitrate dehydrogenase
MTQRDVVKRIVNANRSPADARVADISSRPLITVPSHTSLHDCSSRMLESSIRRVVVERDGVPVGIVSDTDLFRLVDAHGWIHA